MPACSMHTWIMEVEPDSDEVTAVEVKTTAETITPVFSLQDILLDLAQVVDETKISKLDVCRNEI